MPISQLRAVIDLDPARARTPPREFRIFTVGINRSTQGDFLFDEAAAASVMQAAREHGIDFSIDYDHHTLYSDRGVKAIAAGWFTPEIRAGELWATNVKWTPQAEAHLRAGEFRYFSPLFNNTSSGRVTKLINCALSNTPSLYGIEPLVAASSLPLGNHRPQQGDRPMIRLTSLSYQFDADGGLTCLTQHGEITFNKQRFEFMKKNGHAPGSSTFEEYVNFCAKNEAEAASANLPPERRAALAQLVDPSKFR